MKIVDIEEENLHIFQIFSKAVIYDIKSCKKQGIHHSSEKYIF